MKITNQGSSLPDNGEHIAELMAVDDLGYQDTRYGRRKMAKLVFRLDDSDVEQWWFVKPTTNVSSNFMRVVEALLGEIPSGAFDTKILLGKKCLLVTQQYVNDEGKPRSAIRKVLPLEAEDTDIASPRWDSPELHREQQANYHPFDPSEDELTDENIPF